MLEEGKPAPLFSLPSDDGQDVALESFRGRPVVLYFYPRDDTLPITTRALLGRGDV
jgi:peroxiredoxin Q/BCP